MLQIVNLHKSYGDQSLFDGISFSLSDGERIGLVGRNGCGKSTLFRIILGQEQPDDGQITFSKGYTIGHLAQHLNFTEKTVLQEACLGLPADERDQEYRAEIILSGLGFSEEDYHQPPEMFSGGFQIRINLAKVLLSEPNLLLLDEPTNYLDIVSARWLTRFLQSWKNEMIIISHDREFMDSVTTHTMLIHRQDLRKIAGGTQKLYDQVAQDEEIYEKTRVNEDKKRKEIEAFIARFRAQAAKATLVQSKVKALERMGQKEKLQDIKDLDFEFRGAPFQGKFLMEIKDLSFKYPSAADGKDNPLLIENLSLSIRPGDRIAIIGKNGKGKSTLLRLLAQELEPASGEIAVTSSYTKIGYFGQTNINRLDAKSTVEDEVFSANNALSRTAVRNICGTMMFQGDDALKKVSVLSGGEKSRVLLAKMLAQPSNLLLLDEPTNHLDITSIEALTDSLTNYPGAVIIVTHSELILRRLATKLVVFQGGAAEVFDGSYDDFLERVGWEEEADLKPSKSGKKNKQAKKGKNNQDPSLAIENRIAKLEMEIEVTNQKIIEASNQANSSKIAELSKSLKSLQQELKEQYELYEKLL